MNAARSLTILVAAMLGLTALLKVLEFLSVPISSIQKDPGVPFLTNRELLLLACIFELAIAWLLLKSAEPRQAGLSILYFSGCASIYQFGLLLLGGHQHCSCLGVATHWLGGGVATWLSRAMLLSFWICGFLLVRQRSNQVRLRDCVIRLWLMVGCIGAITAPRTNVAAGEISVSGELRSTYEHGGNSSEDTKVFQASFDENSLLLTYVPPQPPQRYNVPPLSNTFFISKEYNAVITLGMETDMGVAAFRRPEYAWQLGNCGDGLASRVFVTIRCLELFPQGSASYRRPLAVASTVSGEPYSLISEASYDSSESTEGEVITCEIRVSDVLRSHWPSSLLLRPDLDIEGENEDFRRAQAQIARYWDGFLLERVQFSRFTNVGGLRFPTLAEFWKYAPPRTNVAGQAGREIPYGQATLALKRLEYSAAGNISFPTFDLPNKITVTEERLTDRALHIGGVTYQTYALASLNISPIARAEFARAIEAAGKKKLETRIRKTLSAVLIAALLTGPLVILKWSRSRHLEKGDRAVPSG